MNKVVKIFPKIILYLLAAITVVLTVLEFAGGVVDPTAEYTEPAYLDLYLQWMYITLCLAIVVTLVMSIYNFIKNIKSNTGTTVRALIGVVFFAAILLITFKTADTNPLTIIGYEGTEASDPFWLSMTSMFISSTFILLAVCVIMMIIHPIVKMFRK